MTRSRFRTLATLAPLLAVAGVGFPPPNPEPDGSIPAPRPTAEVVVTRTEPVHTTRQQRRAAERRARKRTK